MVGVIDAFRWALLGGKDFPADSFAYSLIVSLAFLFIGLVVFRRLERKFADVI
jgi:lipopolysaccharide transport system permease protein